MESRILSSGSNSSHRSDEEGEHEHFCYCGLSCPRRTSWTRMNPGRRFYGCTRYREGSKSTEVILDLFNGRCQPPSTFVDHLNDVDSKQVEASSVNYLKNEVSKQPEVSSVNYLLKNEVSRMKIERKCYQMFIIVLFYYIAYLMIKCKALEDNKKFLQLP
ncbi:hypothetical protein BT93_L5351 [Corymbia citriodora subsp. variegata]|uniref:Zinc finger GRF-type domain-containing protein n=1 Tax=Corymbia citriodora subsp. variegata TaxID=360336 RepID=A0A8T0D184_CORYI|nr:hypothetical protein BT93_L5351 [Corymbia citriodora subsp. variegata]